MDFTKILKVTLPVAIQVCSLGCFANDSDITQTTDNSRYIIKLNDNLKFISENKARDFIEYKINSILELQKTNDFVNDSDMQIQKITNNLYTVELAHGSEKKLTSQNDDDIAYLVEDRVGVFKGSPSVDLPVNFTPDFQNSHSSQWNHFSGPAGINLETSAFSNDGAWSYWQNDNAAKRKASQVVVGVLDTGIEKNSNLDNNVLPGWNFSANNDDLTDQTRSNHGTHVAGIVAAHGPVVYGVAQGNTIVKPNVKILPVKIPGSNSKFFESNVLKSIYWAIGEPVAGAPVNQNPVKVINTSFGIDTDYETNVTTCSPAVQDAIDKAMQKNVVIVSGAGNDNNSRLISPSSCKNTIKVASTGRTALRSYFSNYGSGITVAAPGGDQTLAKEDGILSTVKETKPGNGFQYFQGTSMATPHVAGLVALIHALNDNEVELSVKEITDLVTNNTHAFGYTIDPDYSCVGNKSCGSGIIDAKKTLDAFAAKFLTAQGEPN